nr:MAG TPA: hypothetical protein [Caudoviricetes sp.]
MKSPEGGRKCPPNMEMFWNHTAGQQKDAASARGANPRHLHHARRRYDLPRRNETSTSGSGVIGLNKPILG